jgi:hypothetical protein
MGEDQPVRHDRAVAIEHWPDRSQRRYYFLDVSTSVREEIDVG